MQNTHSNEEWRQISWAPNYRISNQGKILNKYGKIRKMREMKGRYFVAFTVKSGPPPEMRYAYLDELLQEFFPEIYGPLEPKLEPQSKSEVDDAYQYVEIPGAKTVLFSDYLAKFRK